MNNKKFQSQQFTLQLSTIKFTEETCEAFLLLSQSESIRNFKPFSGEEKFVNRDSKQSVKGTNLIEFMFTEQT